MDRCELDILDVSVPGRTGRVFTLLQANRSLVLVRRVVADVVAAYARAAELQQVVDAAQLAPDYGQRTRAEAELAETVETLQGHLWELDEIGVELRNWEVGRVDFPSFVAGRQVCLSWKPGDPEVMFWHEVHPADESLRPIDTLPIHPAETARSASR